MEHDFKIGDWVVATDIPYRAFKDIRQITEIKNGDSHESYLCGNQWLVSNQLEIWKPKLDEWCWFWNVKKPESATLAQFDKIIKIDHTWDIAYTEVLYKSKESDGLFRYIFCEPFTGSLPSFIKE